MTMIKYVEHMARALIRHNTEFTSAVKKVAHTRLPSIGFQSWSRLLTVSLETWVINPAVGCQYFPPGPQFKIQILRSRWKSVEKCLYRASRWTDTSKTMHSVANRIGKINKDTVRISSSKMSTDYQDDIKWKRPLKEPWRSQIWFAYTVHVQITVSRCPADHEQYIS